MLEEHKLHLDDEKFDAERYFLNHANSKISLLTADLITEKYTLSKVHSKIKKIEPDSERLLELVPRIVFELKNSIIIEKIRQKLLEMKNANDTKNTERMAEIMNEMSRLEIVKKQLAKTLGERIIIKL
jgi:DNA primase